MLIGVSATTDDFDVIRTEVRRLCDTYGNEYWRSLEPNRYPEEFVAELTRQGWLSALIPEEYGGGGLSLAGASVILEEISASGGNPSACHAQMYVMGTVLRHGSDEQKQRYLPKIANGETRLQAFGVTEPEAGSETTEHPHPGRARRRRLADQRPEDLDVASTLLRPDDPARADDADRRERAGWAGSRSSCSSCGATTAS